MEWIGLQLATAYAEAASTPEEQTFAAEQKKEEGRHVAVCRDMAREFGGLIEPSRHLRWMEGLLVRNPHLEVRLLGLLGGDIMGEYLIRRLLTTPLPEPVRATLEDVLEDEERHITFLSAQLGEALRDRPIRRRLSSLTTQVGLLFADLLETFRLGRHFRELGLDPRSESVMGYLHYRRRMGSLASAGGVLILPEWLLRVTSGSAYAEAEERLRKEMS